MSRNVVRVKRGMSIFRNYEVRERQFNRTEEHVNAIDTDSELDHEFAPLVFEAQVNAPLIVPPPPEQLNNADESASLDLDTDFSFS